MAAAQGQGRLRHQARSGPSTATATATPSSAGAACMARRLIEAGVPFVEVGQENYDSHADNFVCHKARLACSIRPGRR